MELNCTFLGSRSFTSKTGVDYTIMNFASESLGESFDLFLPNNLKMDLSKVKYLQSCVLQFKPVVDNRRQLGLRLESLVF